MTNDVTLGQFIGRRVLVLFVDGDEHGIVEAESGQVFDGFGLRGGEKHRLSSRRQIGQNAIHRLGKSHVQNTIRLVQYQQLHVVALRKFVFV